MNEPPTASALEVATHRRLLLLNKIWSWRRKGCPDNPPELTFEIIGRIDDQGQQFYELSAIDRDTAFEIDYGVFINSDECLLAMQGIAAALTLTEEADA